MHTLHTTDAFIIGSTPHGENNRVYSLFTHKLGFLYAHGQGVRQLQNRNRYALRTGNLSSVTLVRGREVWRITGAQLRMPGISREDVDGGVPEHKATARERRVLALLQSFAPREEPLPHLFTTLFTAHEAFNTLHSTQSNTIEMLAVLRILHALGYVAVPTDTGWPRECVESSEFSGDLLRIAEEYKPHLVKLINSALASANT